jgi:transposase
MTPHKDFFLDPPPPAPTPTLPEPSMLSEALQVCHPHAAGIDIGEAEHWVAVPPGCDPQPVRRFGTFTADLDALADWLIDGGVPTVAMASTGVSWMPLFELLEARGMQVLLIDPRQAKRAPGRPTTDRLDCQWLQRLHAYGLLAGAFRPEDQVCVLRSSLRHRQMLLTSAAHHMQHMQKALHQMNLKRTQVVSDVTGVTGMRIIKAIVAGERDPQRLAKLRTPHCHHEADDIAKALQGPWRAEPLFALRQAVELYEVSPQQIAQGDQQITRHLETFVDKSAGQPLPPKARRHTKTNEPRFDARTPLSRMAGVDLTTLEGIEANTAWVILSAIGTDMHRWPSVKHFCSWLGLCPQHQISGGKVLSRRVRPGAHRVTVALRLAARSLHHSQSALGAFFRRMNARLGTPKAITATAHQLARLVYRLLQHGSAYVQQGLEAYEAQSRERKVTTRAKQAKTLGYTLVPLPAQG